MVNGLESLLVPLLTFLLGVLATATMGGLTVGRTMASFGVRIEHLERQVERLVQLRESDIERG